MKRKTLLLFISLFLIYLNAWGTPVPPGPPILNVVSSANNNQACKGSTIEIQAIVDSSSYLYQSGEFGPNGGNIIFDKSNDNNGWRYLQLAPYDIILPESLLSGFGCSCENVAANNEEQGGGYDNFQAWLSSPCAAEWLHYLDTLHILGFDDWYIPSLTELNSIYSLASNQSLNVDAFQDDFYWTSSSADFGNCGQSGGIFQKSMQTGNIIAVDRNSALGRIRLVRRFSNIPQYLWSTGSTESSIQVANVLEGFFEYNVQVSAFFKNTIYTFVDGNLVFNRNPYYTVTGNIGINVYSIIQSVNETISEGDSMLFNGVYLKESGIFADTLTDSNGCLVVTQLNLVVLPITLTCRIDVSYCAGDLQQLTLHASPPDSPGNPLSIQWSTGGTSPQITLEPNASGTYSVTVSDNVQTCTARVQIQNP